MCYTVDWNFSHINYKQRLQINWKMPDDSIIEAPRFLPITCIPITEE